MKAHPGDRARNLAIAYAMKRKAQHKAHGGMIEHEEKASGYHSMPKEHEKHDAAAEHEDMKDLNQHGMHEPQEGMETEHHHEKHYDHAVENQGFPHEEDDMVGRIMHHRAAKMAHGGMMHHYSMGGRVANDDSIHADFEPNQFDDLVKDDDLEEHYTGANSGDEIGDEREDHDRHDIVSRIMMSRRKKDRLPHPM